MRKIFYYELGKLVFYLFIGDREVEFGEVLRFIEVFCFSKKKNLSYRFEDFVIRIDVALP